MEALPSRTATSVRLADHMRACVTRGQMVLLDLKRTRYLGLGEHQSTVVCQALATPNGPTTADPLIASLLQREILSTKPANGLDPQPSLPPPEGTFEALTGPGSVVRLRDAYPFAVAVGIAASWLRFRSLQAITVSLRSLHRQCRTAVAPAEMARAVTRFDRLRPLAFTSREQCLFDSLALVIYLAREGLSARWVLGVSTHPFKAHAWVQIGGEVLNVLISIQA